MVQLELFSPARRRRCRIEQAEPAAGVADTSRAAADSLRGEPALTQRERVLLELVSRGIEGATREEIAAATKLRLASVCGRVNELLRLGLVVEPGATRQTESLRAAAVVVAKGTA